MDGKLRACNGILPMIIAAQRKGVRKVIIPAGNLREASLVQDMMIIGLHGHGLIQERNIVTGETVEFEVSGDRIEAVYMIPGWTHNIINLSETEDLVTVMTCNEVFNPEKPDTFFEKVPKGHLAVLPFYFYRREDVKRIPEALAG